MSDKLKPGMQVNVTFSNGEKVVASKLNAIPAQVKNGLEQVEKAIGDIHDESWPYSTETNMFLSEPASRELTAEDALTNASNRRLDIVNLGRLIGPASLLNPIVEGAKEITETVPTGVFAFTLKYLPEDITAIVFEDADVFTNLKENPEDVLLSGDYYIDELGRVYTADVTAGGTVTYTFNPVAVNGFTAPQGARFNTIPDLNQLENGNGCTIGAIDGNGQYTISLPEITHHFRNADGNSTELSGIDPCYLQQLHLPLILEELTTGEEIPKGFLYLKNHTQNEIYNTASYYWNNNISLKIGEVDLDEAIARGDVFYIITIGSSITGSIADLRQKLLHKHDRANGEELVHFKNLQGATELAGDRGAYGPSQKSGNFLPQYLHRDGYIEGVDESINDANCMRGDIVFGVVDASAGEATTDSGANYGLKWKSGSGPQPGINKDSDEALVLDGDQDTLLGIYSQLDSQGVRVKNSVFVPEKGMASGRNMTGIEWPIKPIGIQEYVWNSGAGTTQVLDLADYGLNDSDHKIISVTVLAREAGDYANDFYPPFTSGNWYYGMTVRDYDSTSGSTMRIRLTFTGSNWSAVTDWDIKIMVWYTEVA